MNQWCKSLYSACIGCKAMIWQQPSRPKYPYPYPHSFPDSTSYTLNYVCIYVYSLICRCVFIYIYICIYVCISIYTRYTHTHTFVFEKYDLSGHSRQLTASLSRGALSTREASSSMGAELTHAVGSHDRALKSTLSEPRAFKIISGLFNSC